MPSPPTIDIDALLAPIEGDEPAGESVPFTAREKLEESRKEVNPESFAADDPLRPEPKFADWPAIIRLAQSVLTDDSKDLMVAARLTEALTKRDGFAGLRDGLALMRRMTDECWDRMHPSIEDGDLEVRATPFNWLDDPDRGARFPNSVRAVPLVITDDVKYTWQTWRAVQDQKGDVTSEDFEKAVKAMQREQCQTIYDDLQGAMDEVALVLKITEDKLGEFAPGMVEVRRAMSECQTLVRQVLARKGPAPNSPSAVDDSATDDFAGLDDTGDVEADGEYAAPSGGSRRLVEAPVTREDIYKQLADTAGLLQKLEPHSPIPYLIQRAVELGGLPFPQLMRELIRDVTVLSEMNRSLGIRDESPAE